MKFKIFKLKFTTAVHFGEGGLVTSSDTLMADTIFAALCTEAVLQGDGFFEKLMDAVTSGKLLLSDGLPYIGRTFYVPKPIIEITGKEEGDSAIKKALKQLRYIPVEKIDSYLRGDLEIAEEAKAFHDGFSLSDLCQKVSIPDKAKTEPYAVAVRRYKEESGLYICVGYETEDVYDLFSELLDMLSYSGIGGKRSSGYGRFELFVTGCEPLARRLNKQDATKYMSISVSLPCEEEMEEVISGADFLTVKRSGWVDSISYADRMQKKKDIYMLTAGSVFSRRFEGGIYDVSDGGRHPVYRYGRPMLIGVL